MSGPDLQSLQRWMSRIIRDPRGAAAALEQDRSTAIGAIHPTTAMTPTERLEVYREGYFVRLPEAIEPDFPALERALGKAAYHDLVCDYLVAHPSQHPNLIFASAKLPQYLCTRDDLENHEFLADLAQLEWLRIEAFHASRAEPLDVAALQALTPEQMATQALSVDPSLRLCVFAYPVHTWHTEAMGDEGTPEIPAPATSHIAVFRPGFFSRHLELTAEAYATLDAIARGLPLIEALEHAGDSAGEVGQWFETWAGEGLFVQGP